MDQANQVPQVEGSVENALPPQPAVRQLVRRPMGKLPKYDSSETIEQYFERAEGWFLMEDIVSEKERYGCISTYLSPAMFGEVSQNKCHLHLTPYTEMKRVLIKAFGLNEYERITKLTESIQLGDKKPGDLLRDMQQLAATADTKILVNLWLQRLPPALSAALSTSVHQPISNLREMANTIYSHMNSHNAPQVAAFHTTSAYPPSYNEQPFRTELTAFMNQVLAAVDARLNTHRPRYDNNQGSRGRNSFRGPRQRSSSRDTRAVPDQQGLCWYHDTFGEQATKCKPGCTFRRRQ